MLKSYMVTAGRVLWRQKGSSFINVAGLALGLTCFILIGLAVRDELSFDRFHEKGDRIYRVLNRTKDGNLYSTPTYALAPALKDLYPEVEAFSRVWSWQASLVTYGKKRFEEDRIALADPDFFRMFTFPFVAGDPNTALDGRDSVVLTEAAARRYFGDEEPIGKVLVFDRLNTGLTVRGVVSGIPSNSTIQFEMMARVEFLGEDRLNRWEEWTGPCYVLLRPGVSASAFGDKIRDIYRRYEKPSADYVPVLQPMARVRLDAVDGRVANGQIVFLVSLVALFILAMACINFANLATARFAGRAREVGMRKVVGASRSQLVQQFLQEALLTAAVSTALAVLLAEALLPWFNSFTGKSLTLLSAPDAGVLGALILIAIVTGLLAGSYPALFLSSFRPGEALKQQGLSSRGGSAVRKALIVFQFSLSAGLIVCTLVVSDQLRYIQTMDLGLNRDNVVILRNSPDLAKHFEAFKDSLLQSGAASSVTSAAQGPTWVGESIGVYWEANTEDGMQVDYTVVDYDFFRTFDMKILQGRDFTQTVPTDEQEACVISETAARRMGMKDPIGQTIYMNHPAWPESFRRARIIGVVNDFHARTVHTAIRPFVFRMYRPWQEYVFVKIDPGRVQVALKGIQRAYSEYAPGRPFEYMFYDDAYARQYTAERIQWTLFRAFGLLSIVIACLGLFGLAAYGVEQRTREIGIRKVLGATIPGIYLLLNREYVAWIAVSNLIAWPLAYSLMRHWLQGFSYRVDIGPAVFAAAAGLTLLVALLSVSVHALRAARVDPAVSMRSE